MALCRGPRQASRKSRQGGGWSATTLTTCVIVTAAKGHKHDLARTLARKQHRVLAEHESIDALSVVLSARASRISSATQPSRTSRSTPTSTAFSTIGTLDTNMLPDPGVAAPGVYRQGVGVAVLDTGIVEQRDPVAAFYDFLNGGKAAKPLDPFGHGTRRRPDHGQARQVGRALPERGQGVRLIGLRVLDASGSGYTSTVIQAIEFAIANKATLGIDVLNLSLGHPIYEPAATDPLVQAVERAVAAGIVVVTSAGNEGTNRVTGQVGYAGITSPGNAPSAITVGAVDTRNTITRLDDQVTTFSSRGPTWYDMRSLTW